MKKIIMLANACLLSILPCAATQYVGVNFGTNLLNLTDQSDKGLKVGIKTGAVYGVSYDTGLRAELDFSYRYNRFKTRYDIKCEDTVKAKHYRSFQSYAYMANGIYDVKQLVIYGITPYFGVGVGYADNTEKNKVKTNSGVKEDKLKDYGFAYQGILGAKYALQPDVDLAFQYTYFLGQSHAKIHSFGMSVLKNF